MLTLKLLENDEHKSLLLQVYFLRLTVLSSSKRLVTPLVLGIYANISNGGTFVRAILGVMGHSKKFFSSIYINKVSFFPSYANKAVQSGRYRKHKTF